MGRNIMVFIEGKNYESESTNAISKKYYLHSSNIFMIEN